MALKNLFDMVKADRYTQDGREELIKAQEAETEDKVYQIGEISQKTGLQKTANGWVKPKNGKQPGAKKEEPKNVHGAEVDKIYERQLKRIKELKAKGFTDEQIDNDKIIKQTKEDMKNVGKKSESKPAAQEEIGKFYTKFKDAQSAYDAGRQTFPEGGYKIYNTPQGYKVVDDPKTQQRMEAAGYEVEVDVPEGTKPPKSPKDKPAAERKPDGVDEEGNIKIPKAGMNVLVKVNGNRPGKIVSSRGDYVEVEMPARGAYPGRRDTYYKSDLKFDEEMKADALERSDAERATDAAPRQLTGDTKIRIRKA